MPASKKTPKVVADIVSYIAQGMPKNYAYELAGIGSRTGRDWYKDDPMFARKVDAAAAVAVRELVAEVRDQKGSWKILKSLAPDAFKENQTVDVTNSDGSLGVSDEQIKKAAMAIVKSSNETSGLDTSKEVSSEDD